MHDNDDLMLLLELAAEKPMNRDTVISKMRSEFTEEELEHIIIGAGAALVIHGVKPIASDIDCEVDSLMVLEKMAESRKLRLSKSKVNGAPRLEVGGFAELFYDPVVEKDVMAGVKPRDVVIEGVRVDSPQACVAWYEYMVRKVGRPKDSANLELAKSMVSHSKPGK